MKKISGIICSLLFLINLFSPSNVFAQNENSVSKVNVLIGFNKTPGNSEQALVRAFGGEISYSYTLVPAIAATIPESAIQGLSKNPNVTIVEPDTQVYAHDVESDNSWGVNRTNAIQVQGEGSKGAGVKIAILDSGVNVNHPDLNDNIAGAWNFVENDNDPSDVYRHGTHVAGTACAEDNNNGVADPKLGVVGVAPECDLYALRVLDDNGVNNWSAVIAGMEYVVNNGIDVANLSLGSSGNPGNIVKQAFDNAEAAGVFIAASAGNAGNPGGNNNTVEYPAKYSSVIAVGAIDESDQRPSWSSTGSEVELTGPGVAVYSTWTGSTSPLSPQPVCGNDANGESGCYKYGSGTSMSSPHVAGAAALVIGAGVSDMNGNGRINDEVRAILNSTAQDIGANGKDNQFGYGVVDAQAAVEAVGPVDQNPSIVIAEPVEGAFITGMASISATASDDNGTLKVDFYVDGNLIGTDMTSPYSINWDSTSVQDGERTLTATVTDTISQTTSDSISVIVDNVNDAPVANAGSDQTVIDTDGNGSEAVTLDGSASLDPDGTIVLYEWLDGQTPLGSGSAIQANFSVGSHTITLRVTDNEGAIDTDEVTITVSEASDVSLTATGYKVKGLQKADLNWSNATWGNVEIYRDGNLVTTTLNDGFYTDNIDQKGSGSYVYTVCAEGTSMCSNESTVSF